MDKIFVTVLDMKKFNGKASVGDTVTLIKDLTNEHDKDAIKVLTEKGDEIGFLANSINNDTTLDGTISATDASKSINKKAKAIIIEKVKSNKFMTSFKAELIFDKKKEKSEVKFTLKGGATTYPGKNKLINDIQASPRDIKLSLSGDRIVAEYSNLLSGYVADKGETFDILKQYISDLPEVMAVAKEVDKGNISCTMHIKQEAIITNLSSIVDETKRIIDEKIDTDENLDDKLEYLRRNKVPENAIITLLQSYVKYPDEVSAKIPSKPDVLYVDTQGLVRKTIQYINVGRNLSFEGERGVGKNVLAETLVWLYNRPLYEFSSNSQHSNNALLGSQTFKAPGEVPEEKKKRVFKSLVNLMKRFKIIKDDKDMENSTNLVNVIVDKIFNQDDKSLVFEKSSIIEAFEVGGIIVLDEFNTALAHVMPLFNSLLDDRRRINVPSYGNIKAHPNFCAIATLNRDYQGTFDSNEATADRFVPIVFPPIEQISSIIQAKVPNISYETLTIINDIYDGLKKAIELDSISDKTLSIRGFIDTCLVLNQSMPLKEALIDNIANRATDEQEREAIKDMINLRLPN